MSDDVTSEQKLQDAAIEAARALGEHFGRPPWLSSIGVGSAYGVPAIVVYLRSTPRTSVPVLDDGQWMGHQVITRMFGEFAPIGRVGE